MEAYLPGRRTFTVAVTAGLLVVANLTPALSAQKPERKQEVEIPGINISLKAGWQLLFHDGCRFAVPGSWHSEAGASVVSAPDGSNVSVRMFKITNWSAHKAQIRAAFGHVQAVHEDSDERLWLEIGDNLRVQHYIDVAHGLNVCSGLLEIRIATTPDAEETAKRIVESIGPAPEKWPPGGD